MKHLEDVGMTYWQHLARAWKIACILVVHGILPGVWETKASDMLCKHNETVK